MWVEDHELTSLAQTVANLLLRRGWTLGTGESCTGGWIAQVCTELSGSSAWFELGVVSYSNGAKQRLLGVEPHTLAEQGAVSEAVVAQMAQGVLAQGVDLAVAVSGIAGPTGATPAKPVGLVCFAWASRSGEAWQECCRFAGDREAVRRQSVAHGLMGLTRVLGDATSAHA